MLKRFLLLALACHSVCKAVEILEDVPKSELENEIWSWECNEGKCRKNGINAETRPIGEEVCKLSCNPGSTLWPRPTKITKLSPVLVRVNPHNVRLVSSIKTDDTEAGEILNGAFDLFSELVRMKDKSGKASGAEVEVYLNIKNPNVYRYTQGVNESYELYLGVTNNKVNATIISENFLGARHGLETLSQLMVHDSASGQILTSSEVIIFDGPVYTHRGITLDTARNFVSPEKIKKTLEAMASTKLNTFHWHLTDSHSFPFQSTTVPNLTKYGAYSNDKVYTEDDIRELIRYALIRGIRIVPELDAPAHVGEGWQWAEGAVVCFAAEPWQKYCVEPPCGQLDPTAEITYQVIKGIYQDMSALFQADHFHMGGDEVNINCWNSSQSIVEEMGKLNLNRTDDGFHELWNMFQKRARKLALDAFGSQVRPVLWTSTLTEGSRLISYLNNSDYIIQIWTKGNDQAIKHLVNNGFEVIFSNYDALYFDCGFGAWVGSGNNWCSPYIPWQTVYENDPIKLLNQLGINSTLHHLALGAEAALWTEQADDASIENRLWPRGSALGEALWSGPANWKEAEHRLLIHRKRMIERGLNPDTIQPEWCSLNQGGCYL